MFLKHRLWVVAPELILRRSLGIELIKGFSEHQQRSSVPCNLSVARFALGREENLCCKMPDVLQALATFRKVIFMRTQPLPSGF